MSEVAAVIFHAPLGTSEAERLVEIGRRAVARDLITTLRKSGVDHVVLVAPLDIGRTFSDLDVVGFPSPAGILFDFGKTLKEVIRRHDLDGILYFGSGSGGLLSPTQIRRLLSFAARPKKGAVLNNFYSCDFAAIAGAKKLLETELPTFDNPLGFAIADAGIPCFSLPRNAATQFDVDTPTDLLVLSETGVGGAETRSFLDQARLTHPFLQDVFRVLADRSAHVTLLGRVNPRTWTDFESEVACRTSGLIEGRGMRAHSCSQVPVLHQLLKNAGFATLFNHLSRAADAALIDTRPLLSGSGALPPASDRFASDRLQPKAIEDPTWRAFTEAALSSPIPVVLGGHCLVSGSLYLIAQASWKERDLCRRLHPEPLDWEQDRP
jgi:hypothetical protein